MNAFGDFWKKTGGRVGKQIQCVVEYESSNGRNTRAFESYDELEQWKLEMGSNIRIVSMRKTGDKELNQKSMVKSYIVRVNGQDHGCWEEKKEAEGYLEMLRQGGTFGVLVEQNVVGVTEKGMISKDRLLQKPGNSSHTAKWDRCVAHVKGNNPDADPYAVCTAMLGDESFKAMDEAQFNGVVDKALEEIGKSPAAGVGSFGITGAGPIPASLLARQDLEGSSAKKSFGSFTPVAELAARIKGNQKTTVAKGGSFKDMWSRVKPR